MDRRTFIVGGVGALGSPLGAEAQQARKVPRIGVLLPGSLDAEYERRLDAFRQGLREQGYSEKQNIIVEYRWADTRYDRFPGLAAELIGLDVDILVVDSTPAAQAAKKSDARADALRYPATDSTMADPRRRMPLWTS